jgi:hypothetical protein
MSANHHRIGPPPYEGGILIFRRARGAVIVFARYSIALASLGIGIIDQCAGNTAPTEF